MVIMSRRGERHLSKACGELSCSPSSHPFVNDAEKAPAYTDRVLIFELKKRLVMESAVQGCRTPSPPARYLYETHAYMIPCFNPAGWASRTTCHEEVSGAERYGKHVSRHTKIVRFELTFLVMFKTAFTDLNSTHRSMWLHGSHK